ncbi:hypothetical protein [Nocardiopsis sp. YSL2]|uniref:hypothetical protein n=1 Tax=Nocardiopsis sp. YSL2 TaxID=2939492 RepID=UPI0026F414A1|nr:hypothetical protein [Nocardiopsis sp. YSL2]
MRRTPFLLMVPWPALVAGCFGAGEAAGADASAGSVPSDGAGAASGGEDGAQDPLPGDFTAAARCG